MQYADTIVRTTQPSALAFDLNSLQRSNSLKGLMRMFTAFMTWSFKYGNRVMAKTEAYKDGQMTTTEYSRFILNEVFLTSWANLLLSDLLYDGEIPEAWEWLLAPLTSLISWIPIVRDIPSNIKYGKPIGSMPAFEGLNRIVKSSKTTFQWLAEDKEFNQVLWDLGRAIEFQTGVPALNIVKQVKRMTKNLTDLFE